MVRSLDNRSFAVLIALGMALAAMLAAIAPVSAVAQTSRSNWIGLVEATDGGFRMGNQAAANRLVVFSSYSCPHCAEFERRSEMELTAGHISPGTLSFELRHLIRNPLDLAAALATECGPPRRFFTRHRAIMRAQDRWLAVTSKATAAQQQRWSSGPVPGRMRAIANDLGFHELLAPHGVSRAALDRCLGDHKRAEAIAATSKAQAERLGITGTPSFVLNGTRLEGVHDWLRLRQVLAQVS